MVAIGDTFLGTAASSTVAPSPFPQTDAFPPVQTGGLYGVANSDVTEAIEIGGTYLGAQAMLGQPTPTGDSGWSLGEAQAQTDRALARIGASNPELARTLAEQSGRTTEEADQPWYKDVMNVAGEVLHATGMDRVLELIGRPAKLLPEIVMDWGEESVWKNVGDALSGKSQVSWDDVLVEKLGMERNIFTSALGFIGDVATDPLTWVTFGAGAIGRRVIGETVSLATAKAGITKGVRTAAGELLDSEAMLSRIVKSLGDEVVGKSEDEILDMAARVLFNETAAGKKLAERATQSMIARVKTAITGVHPEAAGGAAFAINEGAGQMAFRELTKQMDEVFSSSTTLGWARVSKEAAAEMGVDKAVVDDILRGYVQQGTGFGITKPLYAQGKAAAGALGGARVRFSIPILKMRMAGRRLPFVPARADFSMGRRLFSGMSGQVRLMKMIGKGEGGATLSHMHAFWEGGWDGLKQYSKYMDDGVAQAVGRGPRSLFYAASDTLGGVTAKLTPHAQVLRGGGLGAAHAADTATMGRHLQTQVAQEIETVRLGERVLNPNQVGELVAKAEQAAGENAALLGDHLNEYARLMGGDTGNIDEFFDPRIAAAEASGNLDIAATFKAEKARAEELAKRIKELGGDDDLVEVWRQVGRNTNHAAIGSGATPDVEVPGSGVNDVLPSDVPTVAPMNGEQTYRSPRVKGGTEINDSGVLTDQGDNGTLGRGLHMSNRGPAAEHVTSSEVDEVRRVLGDGADPGGIDPVSGQPSMFSPEAMGAKATEESPALNAARERLLTAEQRGDPAYIAAARQRVKKLEAEEALKAKREALEAEVEAAKGAGKGTPGGAWKQDPYRDYTGKTPEGAPNAAGVEEVPLSALKGMEGNKLGKTDLEELKAEIEERGLDEPIIVTYDPETGRAVVGEGNHRVAALQQLGYDSVPVRVVKGPVPAGRGVATNALVQPDQYGWVPANMGPSWIGMETVAPAADASAALAAKLAGRSGTWDEMIEGLSDDEVALFRDTLDEHRRAQQAVLGGANKSRLEARAAAPDPAAQQVVDDYDAVVRDLDEVDSARGGEASNMGVEDEATVRRGIDRVQKLYESGVEFVPTSRANVFINHRSGTYVYVENGKVLGYRRITPKPGAAGSNRALDGVDTAVETTARGPRDDLDGLGIADVLHDQHWEDSGIDTLEKAREAIASQGLSSGGVKLNRRAVKRMRDAELDKLPGGNATPGTVEAVLEDASPELRAILLAEEDRIRMAEEAFGRDPELVITGPRNTLVRDLRETAPQPGTATLPLDPVSEFEQRVRPLLEAAAGGDEQALRDLLEGMDAETATALKQHLETRPGAVDEQMAELIAKEFGPSGQGYTDMVVHYDDGEDVVVFMGKDGTVPVARVNNRAAHVSASGTQLRSVTPEARANIIGKGRNPRNERLLNEVIRKVSHMPRDKAEAEARRLLGAEGVDLGPGVTIFDPSMTAALHGSADRVANRVATQYTGEAVRHADNLGFTRGEYGLGPVGAARYRTILSEAGRKWAEGLTVEQRAAMEHADVAQNGVISQLKMALEAKMKAKLAAEESLRRAQTNADALKRPKPTPGQRAGAAPTRKVGTPQTGPTPGQIVAKYKKEVSALDREAKALEKRINTAEMNSSTAQSELGRVEARATTERAPLLVALAPAEGARNMAGMRVLDLPGFRDYAMPEFMAEEFEHAMFGFPKLEGAHLAFRKFNNMWKQFATWLVPGFHIRNVQGAFFNNWLGGVGLRDYIGGQRIMKAMDEMAKGQVAGKWTKTLIKDADKEMFQGLKFADPTGMMFGRPLSEVTYGDLALLSEGLNLTSGNGRAFAEAAVRSEVRAKQVREQLKKAATKGKGRTYIERVPKGYTRAMRWAGTNTENFFRLAAFQKGLRDGMGMWESRAFTMMRHGDYEDMTDFEYGVVRDLIPFYKWMRTNTPFQIHQLLESPAKLLAVQKGQQALYSAQGLSYEDERKRMPGWMTQGLSIPYGVTEGENGEKMFDTVLLDLPFADLYMGGKEFVSSFLPAVRPFVESYIFEKQTFSGAPLEGKQVPMNPLLAPLAPLLSVTGLVHKGADGQAYMSDKTQNIMGILPLYSRFKSWIYADDSAVSKRANAVASAGFGFQMRKVDEDALTSAELDFYYSQVVPTMDYLRALQYPLPTTDEIGDLGQSVDGILSGLGVAPAAPTTPAA